MNWRTISSLIGLLMLSTKAIAEFKTISSIDQAKPFLEKADKNTLVIFDVDYVLTQPADPAYQMKTILHHKKAWARMYERLTPLQYNIVSTLIASEPFPFPIEMKMIQVIHKLQGRGVKVIALTGILTGSLESQPSLQDWRYEALKAFDLDFSSSFKGMNDVVFTSLPLYRDNYPVFYNGILFSNGDANTTEKGKALTTFLKYVQEHTGWLPTSIIFLDDRKYNLVSVAAACATFSPPIHFRGLLYKGANYYSSQPVDEKDFKAKWESLVEKAKELER